MPFCLAYFDITTPFTRTKKSARHPKFLAPYWRHSKLSTCKRIGTKQNLALVPEFLEVPRPPCGGSLGTPKPHLHELKDRHGTPKFRYGAANLMPRPTREVVSAPLNFRTPVPYYFWAHYVYTFKIRSAVPKKLAAPYRNFGVPCRSFCSCKWGSYRGTVPNSDEARSILLRLQPRPMRFFHKNGRL